MDYGYQSKLVKKPGDPSDLTEDQAREFVKCADDIFYFLENYVKIQNPSLGSVLFQPRQYQIDMINDIDSNQWTIFNAPRQTGKSTVMVAVLLWNAIFFKDVKVGIAANKGDAAKEIMDRIRYAYEELPFFLKPAVTSYNIFTIKFDNGSGFEAAATSPNTFRGKSMSIIYLDEFAHVKNSVAEDFWTSLLPTISSEGDASKTKLIITSTPNGTEGLFAQLWFGAELGENGFKSYKVDHTKVAGRGEKFKKEMLKKMTLTKYLQEFEGAFLSSKSTLVSSMVLESLKTEEPYATYRDMRLYRPVKDRVLAVAVDVGTGIGSDYHAVQVWDVNALEQVAEFHDNELSQSQLVKRLAYFLDYFYREGAKEIYYSVENNGYGIGVINLIQDSELPVFEKAEFISQYKSKLPGIVMSVKTKANAAMKFKDLMEQYKATVYSKPLVTELKFFIKSGNSFKAESGMHDDIAMSCLVLMNILDELSYVEHDLGEKWNSIDLEEGGEEPLPMVF